MQKTYRTEVTEYNKVDHFIGTIECTFVTCVNCFFIFSIFHKYLEKPVSLVP